LIREYASYPSNLDELPRILEQNCDVVVVDLDPDPEYALLVVESIYSYGTATVIVCSAKGQPGAGSSLHESRRARVPHPAPRSRHRHRRPVADLRSRPFIPASQENRQKGLCLPGRKRRRRSHHDCRQFRRFGGPGIQPKHVIDRPRPAPRRRRPNLGMVTEYSTVNAVENPSRLDASFLSTLLAKHVSGLSVLAAPSEFATTEASLEAIDRLLGVARQNFDYVIVDAGTRMDLKDANSSMTPPSSTWSPRSASPNCAIPIE